MARRFSDDTLVIASHNPGKVREISALLGAHVRHIRSAGELGLPEPEETGDSFVANAALKARAAAVGAGVAALADDSGLVVPALGGQPGIESARWAGPDRDFGHAMKRIENLLPEHADRGARFVCALALCWPDGHLEVFEGRVDGRLAWPPRGKRGFGYDPIFVADGFDETFGEIDPVAKEAVSHRTDAFRALVAACFDG